MQKHMLQNRFYIIITELVYYGQLIFLTAFGLNFVKNTTAYKSKKDTKKDTNSIPRSIIYASIKNIRKVMSLYLLLLILYSYFFAGSFAFCTHPMI